MYDDLSWFLDPPAAFDVRWFILIPGSLARHLYPITKKKLIRDMGEYVPATENILNVKKIHQKFGAYFDILYGHAKFQVSWIPAIFHVISERQKMSREKPFLLKNFIFFYRWHNKYRFFMKRRCQHIECQDVPAIFLSYILIFQNTYEKTFFKSEA